MNYVNVERCNQGNMFSASIKKQHRRKARIYSIDMKRTKVIKGEVEGFPSRLYFLCLPLIGITKKLRVKKF